MNLYKKRVWLTALLLLAVFSVRAQEMLGVSLGNYSGSLSTLVNPAMLTNSKTFLDVNVVTADLFFRNDMYYIPRSDYSVYKAIGLKPLPKYTSDSINFLMYTDKNPKFFNLSVRAVGPSASFQYGDHGFALTTGARFITASNNIPWEFPALGYIGIKNDSLHNINFIDYSIDLTSVGWTEVGFSYAYNVFKYYNQQLTVGVTVRKIWGYGAVSLSVDNMDYVIVNDSTINIKSLNSDFGFALPFDYDKSDLNINNNPLFKGGGFGFDVGMVYVKKKKGYKRWDRYSLCSQPYEDYDFRLGVSLLDIGSIRFKKNAQYHTYDDVSVYWSDFDTLDYSTINGVMTSLSDVLYGDPTRSLKQNYFSVGLPAALSVQLDVHTFKNLYLGGYWLHPLRVNLHTIKRPAQLAFVPRYETNLFEVSVPVSLYDYKYARVGLSVRLWFFTIGTERLGTWLGMADLNGLDIYTSVKFNIGQKGVCRSRKMNACQNGEYGYTKKQRRRFIKH